MHKSSRRAARASASFLLVMSLFAGGAALAQTDADRSAARAAATEGLHAMQEGRYKDALDLCTRAESLMHAPTHVLLIARANVKLGRLVEAQEAYIKIVRDRLAANAPRAFVEAQAAATEEQAALAPRVPTLKVDVQGADPQSAAVTLDGAPFSSALVGIAAPVDPGPHTLVAKSETAAADPVTVTIAEGAKQAVTLTLRVTRHEPAASTEPSADGAPRATADSPGGASHTGLRTAGWIGVGVGVAGLVVGSIFVIKNHSDRNDANTLCSPGGCPESKRGQVTSLDDDANSAATLSWVSYAVGSAGLVGGAALLWFGRSKPSQPQVGHLEPWVGPRTAGIRVAF